MRPPIDAGLHKDHALGLCLAARSEVEFIGDANSCEAFRHIQITGFVVRGGTGRTNRMSRADHKARIRNTFRTAHCLLHGDGTAASRRTMTRFTLWL